jgi:hypothetical protein
MRCLRPASRRRIGPGTFEASPWARSMALAPHRAREGPDLDHPDLPEVFREGLLVGEENGHAVRWDLAHQEGVQCVLVAGPRRIGAVGGQDPIGGRCLAGRPPSLQQPGPVSRGERNESRVDVGPPSGRGRQSEELFPLREPPMPIGIGEDADLAVGGERDDVSEGASDDHVAVDEHDDPGGLQEVREGLQSGRMPQGRLVDLDEGRVALERLPLVPSKTAIEDDDLFPVACEAEGVEHGHDAGVVSRVRYREEPGRFVLVMRCDDWDRPRALPKRPSVDTTRRGLVVESSLLSFDPRVPSSGRMSIGVAPQRV